MTDAATARLLNAELGSVPEGLDELSEDDLASLAGALRVARRRQSQELEAAIEDALEIVPRLLRGTIRKILFGG